MSPGEPREQSTPSDASSDKLDSDPAGSSPAAQPAPQPSPSPHPSPHPSPEPDPELAWDAVDEASWESFPASDSPAIGVSAERHAADEPPLTQAERDGLLEALRHARLALAQTAALGDHASLATVRRGQAEAVASVIAVLRQHGATPVPKPPPPQEPTSAAAAEEAAREVYAWLHASSERGQLISLYAALVRRSDALHLPMLRHLPRAEPQPGPQPEAGPLS